MRGSTAAGTTRLQGVATQGRAEVSAGVAAILSALLIAILALRVHEIVPGAGMLRPAITLSVASLLVLFTRLPRAQYAHAFRDSLVLCVAAYFVWSLASVPGSAWRSYSLRSSVLVFLPALVMMLVTLSASPTTRVLGLLQRVFAGTVVVQLVVLNQQAFWLGGRLGGLQTFDSNDFATVAAIAFCFSAVLTMRTRGVERIVWGVASGLLIVATGWLNSRGGTLAFAAGALTLVLLQPGRRRWMLLGAFAVGIPVFWAGAPPEFKDRIIGLTDLSGDYNNTDYYGRRQIWARARGYIAESPVTGVGMGAFPIREGLTLGEAGATGKWSNTHNAYLQAYAELGLLGGSIFVWTLLVAARRALRLARPPRTSGAPVMPRPEFLSALVAFAVGGVFLSHAYFLPLFALLALIALASRVDAPAFPGAAQPMAPASMVPRAGWRTARSMQRMALAARYDDHSGQYSR